MKTEEIVDAARDAGFSNSEMLLRLPAFRRLIDSAAAAEREACVKACKAQKQLLGEDEAKIGSLAIAMCVDAISTRGKK